MDCRPYNFVKELMSNEQILNGMHEKVFEDCIFKFILYTK